MKKLLVTTAIALGLSTPVMAGNFDNTQLRTVVYSGNFEFSLSGDTQNGMDYVGVGYHYLHHSLGSLDANVFTELSYGMVTDDVTVDLEYQAYGAAGLFTLYGSVGVEYNALANNFGSGTWTFAPYVGTSYDISEVVGVYGEVGYNWDISSNFTRQGGYAEVGLDYLLTENVAITPYVTRTFDTNNNETQFGLVVGLSF
jgi:hypothetical protein